MSGGMEWLAWVIPVLFLVLLVGVTIASAPGRREEELEQERKRLERANRRASEDYLRQLQIDYYERERKSS